MTLAALIPAGEGEIGGEVGDEAPAALQPIAGVPLIERQARLLAAAGVTRAVLLIEAPPAALAAPLARLRADGIAVRIATRFADAADMLAGEARVVVIAPLLLPDRPLIERIAAGAPPLLATIADAPGRERYERIDAGARWAGLVLLDGVRIADTAAMIGEWDPVSTLLRRAVQEGAGRIETDAPPPIAGDALARATAAAGLVGASRAAPSSWAERWIDAPLADRLLPPLVRRGVDPALVGWGGAALALLGGVLAFAGVRWPALAALLPEGALALAAERLALVQARPLYARDLQRLVARAGGALALVGLGAGLARGAGQWGWLLVALLPIAALVALARLRRFAGRPWLAEARALPWGIAPFALAGAWGAGTVALAGYALASLAFVIARIG